MASRFSGQVALRASGILGLSKTPAYMYRYRDMVPDRQKVLTDGYSLVHVTICFALIITCNIKEAMLHSLFLRLKKGTLLVPCLRV